MESQEDNKQPFSSHHMQEKQWARKVREEGDRSAFENLFRTYYKRLHGFAYSYVRQVETAEDIVQSVFLKIWMQRESWDPPGTVKHYLFAAVRNEALNKIKHRNVVSETEQEVLNTFKELKEDSFVTDDSDVEELRKKIQRGIDDLPPRCRQIFLLNRRSGLTYEEIAAYLDISINTVSTQMGRALHSLRTHLSDYLSALVIAGISKLLF